MLVARGFSDTNRQGTRVNQHTWKAGAESNEGGGGDGVCETDCATEGARQVADDGCKETDRNDAHHKADPTSCVV